MFIQDPPPAPQPSLEALLAGSPERTIRQSGQSTVFEDVLILNRGESVKGVVGSGLYWVVLPVKGRLATGETVFFYKTIFEPGEPAPPIGGLCRLEAQRTTWTGGMITGENDLSDPLEHPPGPKMWSLSPFDCTISSDSPVIVPTTDGVWRDPD